MLGSGKRRDVRGQSFKAAVARAQEQAFAFQCGGEADGAAIGGISRFDDEALSFEGVDDARHGGGTNLLGLGETAEGKRAGEDDDG